MKNNIIFSVIMSLLPFTASAQTETETACGINPGSSSFGGYMGNMMGSWGWFGWTFMGLTWLLAVVGIIALIKWIVKK